MCDARSRVGSHGARARWCICLTFLVVLRVWAPQVGSSTAVCSACKRVSGAECWTHTDTLELTRSGLLLWFPSLRHVCTPSTGRSSRSWIDYRYVWATGRASNELETNVETNMETNGLVICPNCCFRGLACSLFGHQIVCHLTTADYAAAEHYNPVGNWACVADTGVGCSVTWVSWCVHTAGSCSLPCTRPRLRAGAALWCLFDGGGLPYVGGEAKGCQGQVCGGGECRSPRVTCSPRHTPSSLVAHIDAAAHFRGVTRGTSEIRGHACLCRVPRLAAALAA